MLTFNYTCRNIHVHLGNFKKAVTGLRLNIIDTALYTIFPPFHSAVFFPLEYPDLSSEYHFAANQKKQQQKPYRVHYTVAIKIINISFQTYIYDFLKSLKYH